MLLQHNLNMNKHGHLIHRPVIDHSKWFIHLFFIFDAIFFVFSNPSYCCSTSQLHIASISSVEWYEIRLRANFFAKVDIATQWFKNDID